MLKIVLSSLILCGLAYSPAYAATPGETNRVMRFTYKNEGFDYAICEKTLNEANQVVGEECGTSQHMSAQQALNLAYDVQTSLKPMQKALAFGTASTVFGLAGGAIGYYFNKVVARQNVALKPVQALASAVIVSAAIGNYITYVRLQKQKARDAFVGSQLITFMQSDLSEGDSCDVPVTAPVSLLSTRLKKSYHTLVRKASSILPRHNHH